MKLKTLSHCLKRAVYKIIKGGNYLPPFLCYNFAMELKYTDIEKFKPETKMVKRIMFKPNTAPIVCGVIGVGLLALAFLTKVNTLLVALLGVFFIAMAICVLTLVKDHPVLDIYQDGVLVYNSSDAKKVVFINYDMIDMWKPERDGGNDKILFIFEDGSKLPVYTFHASSAFKALDKIQHDKLERVVKARNSKPLVASNPIKNIQELVNKLSKKKSED